MENTFILSSLFILFLPLLAFVIQIFFGKRLPREGDWVSIGAISITLILAITMFIKMHLSGDPELKYEASFVWLDMGAFTISLGFLVDNITIIMLLVVALISTCTHIFSTAYLKGDIRYSRYFGYLGLFTFSMNGIVLANNLMSMYMFWELVGVSSYLLIGHWFEKDSAADASKKAFLTNRVGDIGFFIGIMLIYSAVGSFAFTDVFDGVASGMIAGTTLTLAGVGLFMGAMGKSSQFPLHIWLPDAMEGPTPVSALMHAATMVAAGVYLTVRIFPILTSDALLVVAYVGGFTALFAASIALTQTDIKKVLAYSTVSQLGYMILAVGTGVYTAAFFHLLTHAMFKANLFYGSGSVIHSMHHALHEKHDHETDPQDMRNMGGFKDRMPITYWSMLISTMAIAGVPLFSGFLSKDAILAGTLSFSQHHPGHFLLPLFGFGAAAMTAFYMTRLWMMTFSGPDKRKISEMKPSKDHEETGNWELSKKEVKIHAHEAPLVMTIPLMLLAFMAVFSGFLLFIGDGFGSRIYFGHHESTEGMIRWEIIDHILSSSLTYLSVTVGLTGVSLGYLFYKRGSDGSTVLSTNSVSDNIVLGPIHTFLSNRLYMAKLFDWFGMRTWDTFAQACDWFDRNIVDGMVNGTASITQFFSNEVRKINSGFTGHYASLSIGGLGAIVLFTRVVMPMMGWSI